MWRPRGVELHYEVELGVVIGREIGGVGAEERVGGDWDWEKRWMDFIECEFFSFSFLCVFCSFL